MGHEGGATGRSEKIAKDTAQRAGRGGTDVSMLLKRPNVIEHCNQYYSNAEIGVLGEGSSVSRCAAELL